MSTVQVFQLYQFVYDGVDGQAAGTVHLQFPCDIPAVRDFVVVLDEHGKDLTTVDLARQMHAWGGEGDRVVFVIGGPDGLAPEVKAAARATVRLSAMTLPHALARVLLAEQLYRVWSIEAGHPYHRA